MRGAERFFCVLLLGVALHPAAAQSPDSAVRVLTTPIGPPLLCERIDSASVTQLKLQIGEPAVAYRNLQAVFDSLGRPRMLIDWAAASGRIEIVTVAFDTAGVIYFGFHRLDSLPSLHHSTPPTEARLPPLTEADRNRAKTLAVWVWNHRCHSHPLKVRK